jgi:1,3-beta-galactosyl-N-acetylhexosamine phosphorylase
MKGRITVPTDECFVEGTKLIAEKWGADAVGDCDGTKLPKNPHNLAKKVYQTYFVTRSDVEWAKKNPDELQHFFLSTKRITATEKSLTIRLMDGYFAEQVKPDFSADSIKYWQVMDRTAGKEYSDWKADSGANTIFLRNVVPFHEYSASFMAFNMWDSTQMYNYITNNWDTDKHSPYDPRYPKTKEYIKTALKKWLAENPAADVVRFTTFLYHFFLVFDDKGKEKCVEWFGYNASVSPKALDDFEKEFGYRLVAEDFIDEGCNNNTHRVPKKAFCDYMKFTEKYVAETVKELVDIVHAQGREAMMFLGDSWIGTEPYGENFPTIGLDAIVGSLGGGVTVRMLTDIPGVQYTEGRMLPYFFPDTFFEGNEAAAVDELNRNWTMAKRAMLRKPLDRIGFGGYPGLAAKFPRFIDRVAEICDEFRAIYEAVKGENPKDFLTVCVLNAWGKKRSWMCNMTAHELWYQASYSYQGIYEALSGLPVKTIFLSFDDIKEGVPQDIDVILNAGDAYTSWSGGEYWTDEKIQVAVRKFVYGGGGFIGIGEPTAFQKNGKFFQLSDVMGVEKEVGYTLCDDKYRIEKENGHFITADVCSTIDYGEDKKNIYALSGAEILDIEFSDRFTREANVGEVKAAVNRFGCGRSFYITGLPYSPENCRLLYRALLWAAGKEEDLLKAFSSNLLTVCAYYGDSYIVINNSPVAQATDFYDVCGNAVPLTLQGGEIKVVKAEL